MHFHSVFKQLMIAATAIGMHASAFAVEFPRLEDPQLQAYLTTLQGNYQQYLANRNTYFTPPTESKAWPCTVSLAVLAAISGTVNSDDNPLQKRFLLIEARSKNSEPVRHIFANRTFYPVSAECKNGKLHGPLEFWVEFDQTVAADELSSHFRILKRVRTTVVQNKLNGPVLNEGINLRFNIRYSDPDTAAMMAAQPAMKSYSVFFEATLATNPPVMQATETSLRHTEINDEPTVTLRTIRNYDAKRTEEINYGMFGPLAKPFSKTLYKEGRRHGLEIIYAGMMGDNPTPASTQCWDEGERILTTDCTVD